MMYTSLDVLRPAKVTFNKDADKLLIVNNVVSQPAEYGHHNFLYDKDPYGVALSTDSLPLFCLQALTDDMEGKDFFSTVQLVPNSVNTGKNFEIVQPLRDNTVDNLCSSHHANVILSLDKMKVLDDLTQVYNQETGAYSAYIELRFETSWSVHYLNDPRVSSVQFKDTVFWETESYIQKKSLTDLPKRTDALVDGALNVGHKSVDRFIPYWDKADRYFYNLSNKLMKQGMDSVYVRNWQSAVSSWEKAYKSSKSAFIQAQAANNIAIGYEIMGNLDKALEYATISYYTYGKLNISDYNSLTRLAGYISELNQRKAEVSQLKKQLGE